MLIVNFVMIFIMLVGMVCTLAPKLHGAVIILFAAVIYAAMMNVSAVYSWIGIVLLLLTIVSEIGVKGLRIFWTKHYLISRRYSVNTSICNLAGLIAASALLGNFLGMVVWQIIVGKTLAARLNMIGKILIRLILLAGIRLFCSLLMIIIVMKYIMYTT